MTNFEPRQPVRIDSSAASSTPRHAGEVVGEREMMNSLLANPLDHVLSPALAAAVVSDAFMARLAEAKWTPGMRAWVVADKNFDLRQREVVATLARSATALGGQASRSVGVVLVDGVVLGEECEKYLRDHGVIVPDAAETSSTERPWYDWELERCHVENNMVLGGLPTFGHPAVLTPMLDAVLRFKPSDVFVVHAYKLGFAAFFAACTSHLDGCVVYAVNPPHYDLSEHEGRLRALGLSDRVRHLRHDPFVDGERPSVSGGRRPMVFLNVNTAVALRWSLGWLLAEAEEALLVFHAVGHGDTARFLRGFRERPGVTSWATAGAGGAWCDGGFLLWRPDDIAGARTDSRSTS
jgi:hypothetical protein